MFKYVKEKTENNTQTKINNKHLFIISPPKYFFEN